MSLNNPTIPELAQLVSIYLRDSLSQSFGGVGTTLDHGFLSGLGDDDHPQYLNILRHDLNIRHGSSVVDHSLIGNLTAGDDHTQYMHITNARTVTAIHTLTNGLNIGVDVTLNRKSANIAQLASGDNLQSATYTSGIAGWNIAADGSAEFENVRVRGELSSSVFKVSEITATAGTFGVFKSGSTMTQVVTLPALSGSFHLFVKTSDAAPTASLFAVNDILRIKAWNGSAIVDSWMTVTAVSSAAGITDATCTLNSGTASVTVAAGTAVVDYGPTGTGFITLSSDGAIGSSANMSIATHAGAPWTTTTTQVRLGNLNNSFGIASNLYGIGIGDYASGNYLRYDPTNGFIVKAGNGVVSIDNTGFQVTETTTFGSDRSYKFLKAGVYVGGMNAVDATTTQNLNIENIGTASQGVAMTIKSIAQSTFVGSLTLTSGNATNGNVAFTIQNGPGANSRIARLSGVGLDLTSTQPDVAPGLLYADRGIFGIATGTSPLTVNSTTVVTNLNADLHDGYQVGIGATSIPFADGNNTMTLTGTKLSGTVSVGARIMTNANFNVANGYADVAVAFAQAIYDDVPVGAAASWSAGANTKLFMRVSGVHEISANLYWPVNGTGSTRFAAIKLNGTTWIAAATVPANGTQPAFNHVSTNWRFAAGDYVELILRQDSTTNPLVIAYAPYYSITLQATHIP